MRNKSLPIYKCQRLNFYKYVISFDRTLLLLKFITFLLFPVLQLKKEMEKQKLFVQDKIKAIHKTKTTASIIKHSIIHINMYLEKGMNVIALLFSAHEINVL